MSLIQSKFVYSVYFKIEDFLRLFGKAHLLLYFSDALMGCGLEIRKQKALYKKFYAELVHPADLCFDIGANLGNRVEAFLNLGASVVAVEPQEICTKVLELKFKPFLKNKRLQIVPMGVDSQEGTKELMTPMNCRSLVISTFSDEWIEKHQELQYQWIKKQVSLTTLDKLIETYGMPRFCKIDTEGYEYNVLKGLSHPIPMISFEFNPKYLDVALDCITHLSALGRYTYNYSEGESMVFSSERWLDETTMKQAISESLSRWKTFGDIYCKLSV